MNMIFKYGPGCYRSDNQDRTALWTGPTVTEQLRAVVDATGGKLTTTDGFAVLSIGTEHIWIAGDYTERPAVIVLPAGGFRWSGYKPEFVMEVSQ